MESFCSDEWVCGPDGCYVIVDEETGALTPATAASLSGGLMSAVEDACVVEEGRVVEDAGRTVIEGKGALFTADECMIVWDSAECTEDGCSFKVVCDVSSELSIADDWKMLIGEEDRKKFSGVLATL
ncbi:hypothetical protein TeGR_g6697 [Tetraparma gracilis]|jgi:hypothetical protein|uniref:Uncharacterized protein n=1 Tax=Tetraparma gracilis TaxID=2962635 RepID=A0ABQ6MYT1_9STRA|nr:hypothetical protein TeGR_g6697 [Tetraparma gracilis]